jgi:cobalamin biosynthesis protein CobT
VVGGAEEEDGDEPEEGADNCCQHDANAGNSENSANSSDLENSDDMLQDDEEDLIIDHTTSMHAPNQAFGRVLSHVMLQNLCDTGMIISVVSASVI